MTGNDLVNLTLPIEGWREVYRILKNDGPWKAHLTQIEQSCRNNQLTIQFKLAMTWCMASTVRSTNPELADEISRQMSAQYQTAWWDSAWNTPTASPADGPTA